MLAFMRIVGYARLSRATREESTSIVRQREIIAKTCDARGFDLVDTIEDVDVSATRSRLDRPGLHEVRRIIAAGEADAVMVWRLDRLVRSVVDVGILLDEGLQIISATEALDTTSPMGRAMVEILQVFASMEAKTTGLRVADSQRYLRKVGRFPGGVIPYGYRTVPHPDGIGRALEPDPAEAVVVRRIVDAVLAGESIYSVAQTLSAEGIRPRRSPEWSVTSIRQMLRADALLGRTRSQGELVRDETGVPVEFWPPLVTVEEVERLRALTEPQPQPDGQARGRRKANRLLSGLLTCPTCGGALVVNSRANQPTLYGCASRARGRVCAKGIVIDCERVEAEVTRQFLKVVGHYSVVEPRTVAREVAGLAAVEEAIRHTTDALREPDADVLSLVDRLNSLRTERERLDALPYSAAVEMVETGETFAEAWARHDTMGRRALLLTSGVSIGVAPARQRGTWDPSRVSLSFAG
jgi:site-specific DNA recombinase